MKQDEFDSAMLRLCGVYHEQGTTKQQRAELHRVLSRYPAKAVDRAIDVWVEKSQYMPKPAQLLELIDKGPVTMHAPCGVCDGTGWVETTAPEVDRNGMKAVSDVEQPWVYKCTVCGGSGGGRG